MKDLRRIAWCAVLLIVLLRMSIGWQFLYEGMWKFNTLGTAEPWTAEGYLKNAQGPFRDYFREMTGDPDDLGWLDYENMSRRWYAWRDRFVAHYQLDEEQQNRLNRMLDGSAQKETAPDELPPFDPIRGNLAQLPEPVDLDRYKSVVRYDEEHKRLVVLQPVLPSEENAIKGMVDVVRDPDGEFVRRTDLDEAPDAVELEFFKTFETLVNRSRNLSLRHRLAAALRGDPDKVGVVGRLNERGSFDIKMGTVTRAEEDAARHNIRYGKIQEYKDLLEDYEEALQRAAISYQHDHANMLGRKVTILRNELVSPIRELEAELKEQALKVLTREQMARGAVPPEDTPLHRASMQAMWGLLILGALLLVGFFTRIAALAGAGMMLMFYLVIPPWPGVPPAPGPEHSLIVNKNLIECIALLAIASLPTGTWFGIDGAIYRCWASRKGRSADAARGQK